MGGRGSGGRRTGSGRKQTSDLELAIGGTRSGVVVPFASTSSTAVAPVSAFDPPAELAHPPLLTALVAALDSADDVEKRKQLQARIAEVTALGLAALAVWHELAPHAFTARTLTPATTAVFVMLCRAIVRERDLALTEAGGANHRGLMQRISTWTKDFSLAPMGKPLYAAESTQPTNPLDRFTRRATDVDNSASGGGGAAA
jgi:hypothetical protein